MSPGQCARASAGHRDRHDTARPAALRAGVDRLPDNPHSAGPDLLEDGDEVVRGTVAGEAGQVNPVYTHDGSALAYVAAGNRIIEEGRRTAEQLRRDIQAKAEQEASSTVARAQEEIRLERDRVFYEESGGGVTFSGGEPLSQPSFLRQRSMRANSAEMSVVELGFSVISLRHSSIAVLS